MRKIPAIALMIFFVLGGLFSRAWAKNSDHAAESKEVKAYFNRIGAMFDKKDVEGLAATLLPDATFHYANGTDATAEEWKKSAKDEFTGIATMKSKFKIEKVVARGDSIVATYLETHNYTLTTDRGHKYRSLSRWSATLVKTPQGLRAAHFVEFFEKVTRNGKPFTPRATPNPL